MNIFGDYSGILGRPDYGQLRQADRAFWETARSIRARLGVGACHLDRYLDMLLKALHEASADNAVDHGTDHVYGELRHICEDAMAGGGDWQEHPFYPEAKRYIDGHPSSLRERGTKLDLAYIALAPRYTETAASVFFDERMQAVEKQASLDLCALNGHYDEICRLLGSEEEMEHLNDCIRRRFVLADFMSLFVQGFLWTQIAALTTRDGETGKTVLQLALEQSGD